MLLEIDLIQGIFKLLNTFAFGLQCFVDYNSELIVLLVLLVEQVA